MASKEFVQSRVEMEEVLRREAWGCLGVCTADGHPYVVPINYAYVDGKVLFHCALEGKKLDCIRANPGVCFTVARQPGAVREHPGGAPCHVDNDSVICYGEARIVVDLQERVEVLNRFNRVFRPEAKDLSLERAAGCAAVEISIREMTGRRERDGQRTMWRYIP
jgi:uncharacterized protein